MTRFGFFVAEIPRGPGQRPGPAATARAVGQVSGRMPYAKPTDASLARRPE